MAIRTGNRIDTTFTSPDQILGGCRFAAVLTEFLCIASHLYRRLDASFAQMKACKNDMKGSAMLRLLIPVVHHEGALQAARHAAFLFAERCVAEVELVEVLESPDQRRTTAFHFRSVLRRKQTHAMLSALKQTRAILDDAGVPYHWTRVVGPVAETIAARAAAGQSDAVIVDASQLGFLTRWWILAKLWRLSSTPVTMLR